MEQSPFSGYVKAAAFGILAFAVFTAVWQRSKLEDKIVELDGTVAEMDRAAREDRGETRELRKEIQKLRGANETLLKLIASGAVRAGPAAPTNERPEPGSTDEPEAKKPPATPTVDLGLEEKPEWGWQLNEQLDRLPDPSLPVGTPGRYKNFLTLDPDGNDAPKTAPNYDGTINLGWGPEPKGFNFLLENYATLGSECQEYCLDAPASYHWKKPSAYNWAPSLCWRVEVSPDYKEYTLFFRRDPMWQPVQADTRKYPHLAGKHPVTARDAAFTFQLIQDRQSNLAVLRSYYDRLDSVEAIDDYTLVVRWKETLYTSIAWTLGMYIMPEFVYAYDQRGNRYPTVTVGQEFNEHWYDQLRLGPVGCGPYRFTKFESGKYVRMERWDDYYGFKDEPLYPIKVRHLKIYNESETAMNWLRAGELDTATLTASRYRDWVLEETNAESPFKNGEIKTYLAERPGYLYIGWKNSDPLFSDKRVRKALTYACDRFQICKKIFLGRYTPMSAPLYPASEEADPTLEPYPFDLEKAKQLLDEAGWKLNPDTGLRERVINGEVTPFEFTFYYPSGSTEMQNAADHYKNDLLKIGIRMTPFSVQWAQFQKDLNDRKYKAFSLLWMLSGWDHDFVQIWHSRGIEDPKSSNYIEFSNPELDRLADELRTEMDPQKRIDYVRRIGRILYEEQPYTFFAWRKDFRSYWTYVKNFEDRYFRRPFIRTFPMWIER
jgi:peptide/nickel transport system substrate-binding protein